MAHAYKLVDENGNVLLDMNASPWALTEYQPIAPTKNTQEIKDQSDGGEIGSDTYNNVRESAEFQLADTKANIITQLTTLERIWEMARAFQRKKVGTQVFLQYQADSGTQYRSEILTGSHQPDKDALDWQWCGNSIVVTITYLRRFYWEGAEAAIALTNGSGSATGPSYLTLYNHDDAGANHDCWANVAAAQVAGDMETPIRLEIYSASIAFDRVFIGIANDASATTRQLVYEAEDASTISPATASTANAGASGGYYVSPSTNNAAGEVYFEWPVAFPERWYGKYFVVLARLFSAFSSGAPYLTMSMRARAGSDYYSQKTPVLIGNELMAVGTIPIPPERIKDWSPWSYLFRVIFNHTPLTAGNVPLDYVLVLPIDCYRYIDFSGTYSSSTSVIDNSIPPSKITAGAVTSSKYYAVAVRYGNDLTLIPNTDQRIVILHEIASGVAAIASTISVRAYYRPRRKMPV